MDFSQILNPHGFNVALYTQFSITNIIVTMFHWILSSGACNFTIPANFSVLTDHHDHEPSSETASMSSAELSL